MAVSWSNQFHTVGFKLSLLIVIPLVIQGGSQLALAKWSSERQSATASEIVAEFTQAGHLAAIKTALSGQVVDTAIKLRLSLLFWGEGKNALQQAKTRVQTHWQAYLASDRLHSDAEQTRKNQEVYAASLAVMEKLEALTEEQSLSGVSNFVDMELYRKRSFRDVLPARRQRAYRGPTFFQEPRSCPSDTSAAHASSGSKSLNSSNRPASPVQPFARRRPFPT
ncbi:MAG: hypothetical protein AB7I68_15065, partial [Porticoccaceae bacterium]